MLYFPLSFVLTVQPEHGEFVQIRAADAFLHPGGGTGGPGPGHRCPQGSLTPKLTIFSNSAL